MSNRLWSSAPNDNRTAPSLPYIYDPNAVNNGVVPPITGNWRPYATTDIGSITLTGALAVLPVASNSVSTSTPSGTNGLALASNSSRKTFFIQNNATGSSPLFVRFDGLASTQSYNMVLNAASSQWAGDGGTYTDTNRYAGEVYISGMNAINYICWEMV